MAGQFESTSRGGLTTFNIVVAAGEKRVIGVRGNFLRVAELTLPRLIGTRSNKIGPKDGREFVNRMKKFEKIFSDTEFDEVTVDNSGDENIGEFSISLQIGYGDYEAEVVSRTLAAQENTYTVYEIDQTILHHDVAPRLFVQVLAEDNQRKRAKIHAAITACSSVSYPGADIAFFAGLTKDTEATWDEAVQASVIGRMAFTGAAAADNVQDLGELETETIDSAYVGLMMPAPFTDLAPGEDITVRIYVTVMEERYSAA